MEKDETRQLLCNMGIKRHQIFISLSSKDKDKAIPILEQLDIRKMNYWCMYYANGGERNISGDKYPETISKNIDASCLFVMLFSKHSVSSNEVKKEIMQVAHAQDRKNIRVIPISLDETNVTHLPDEVKDLKLFDEKMIYRQLGDGSRENLDLVISEIRTQYYDVLLENIGARYKFVNYSYLFTDLLRECLHRKCGAWTVSQDIKASDEGSKEGLLEAHILTDELVEYDFHPYSCMMISSNLLGSYDVDKKCYNPSKNGIKYFYYCPESYLVENQAAFRQKMRDYLEKNRHSRGEVVLMIRRDFDERNGVMDYINSFNKLTLQDLLNTYNITEDDEIELFKKEMEKDENNIYFGYTETADERLNVPGDFYVWMSEDESQLYDPSVRHEAYLFIAFLGRMADVLKKMQSESPAREQLIEELEKYCRYLTQLKEFECWQMQDDGYCNDRPVWEKKMCEHLVGFTEGVNGSSQKYPNLSKWLRIFHDEKGAIERIPEDVVDQALENMTFIPIRSDSLVKPCYSFVVYINKNSVHASWYSTGYADETRDMVVSYTANPEAGECRAYVQAFQGLIESDVNIESVLHEKNSKILELKKGY